MAVTNPDVDLGQERAAEYRSYTVAGSHRDIGSRMGREAAGWLPQMAAGLPTHPEAVAFARACAAEAEKAAPELLEEIRAFAEAGGTALDAILPALVITSGVARPPRPAGQCSSVGVLTGAGPVVARNYDFFYWERMRHLVTARPAGGLASTGTWTGLPAGRHDGANAAGVWVAIHGGGTRPAAEPRPGLPFFLLSRLVLERCRSAREGVELLCDLPRVDGYNYFLADAEAMFVVEAHPEGLAVRRPEDGVLACTNHPAAPDLAHLAESPILANSRARYARLVAAGREAAASPEPAAVLARAMADHAVPVCGHSDGLATLWSARCRPARRELAYALGAPCRNPYAAVEWPA